MKKLILITLLTLAAATAKATIIDVDTLPVTPIYTDVITIFTSGIEGAGGVTVTNSVFDVDGTDLTLDLYLEIGLLTVSTPWSHSEIIGTLVPADYNLTVNTYDVFYSMYDDTFSTTFEVTPEPTSLLLLAMGIIGVRRKIRKESH